MIQLQPITELVIVSKAGSILELAGLLDDHYVSHGYSLTRDDILDVLQVDFLFYTAWATSQEQREGGVRTINENTVISLAEWGIVEPVFRAHLDWIQAQRMESTASLGVASFGLSVPEAKSIFDTAKETMKKDAFIAEPFTIDYDYIKPNRGIGY